MIRLGGVAGCFSYYGINYNISIRNCANYGSVTNSAAGRGNAYLGGIVGYCLDYSLSKAYIQNCLNHGPVTNKQKDITYHYIGGISGYSNGNTIIENCVSAGRISSSSGTNSIEAIIGSNKGVEITHCFWTNDVGYDSVLGYGGDDKVENTSKIEVNMTTVNSLNDYATNGNWSKWLLNKNNKTVTFKPTAKNGKKWRWVQAFITSYPPP